MATFGNVLTRQGGTAMSGKTVTITIAVPDKQKAHQSPGCGGIAAACVGDS